MDYNKSVKLIQDLLDALPRKYDDNRMELVHRHGYLIGLLASIVADDFYAESKVVRRYNEITGKRQ